MPQKREFIPIIRTCERCGKQFQVMTRRQARKKFCTPTCRKLFNRDHLQAERDRARDMAYAKLTLKDYERDSMMRTLSEENEKLTTRNKQLVDLIDELTVVLPRMVETGYISVHADSDHAAYWVKRFEKLQLDWKRLLSPPDTIIDTTTTQTREVNSVVSEYTPLVSEHDNDEWDEWNTSIDDGYTII
ncbi:hypothetical protein EJ419_06245 [Alloscardovia theropitheci]|uniref:Uncharacterized protein n=1 Tax=Alloscardovia theropitheci TaxID=2496842 RepID=A0A4V2MTV0_9BIFI|nr:hypothetical protein [Alloscardovia theropitheci]TCD53849.1 hypothetical protein EJ419_06245 [Alloscardovia theropitheci]